MVERYLEAAFRHLKVGERLENLSELDDAGYHFGVSGENALKALLQQTGVEAAWIQNGVDLRKTPMRAHFPDLQTLVARAMADIQLNASGRHAGAFISQVSSGAFGATFAGWHIDIRYADTQYTPVSAGACSAWKNAATQLADILI